MFEQVRFALVRPVGAACAGLVLGVFGTWLSMVLAKAWGILDQPGAIKIHQRPTPRFGGFGFLLAFVVGGFLSGILAPVAGLGLFCMGLVGGLDDRYNLPPKVKLGGQALAALILAWYAKDAGLWLSAAAFVCVLGMSNAVNLLDGMDGLAGGSTLISFVGLALLGRAYGVVANWELLAAGALAGFLVFNYPKAKTFMGDVGSLSLGYALCLSLVRLGALGWRPLLLGLCITSIPIFDVALGILRRWLNGRPLFEGDRDHFYDQLHRRWKSPLKTIWAVYFAGACVVALVLLPPLHHPLVPVVKAVALIFAFVLFTFSVRFHRGYPA